MIRKILTRIKLCLLWQVDGDMDEWMDGRVIVKVDLKDCLAHCGVY
jgi:hypothetical protein